MIHFNHQSSAAPVTDYHLQIARSSLAGTIDEKHRLTFCLDEAALRIAELSAEKEALIDENVRLTGQIHALLAVIEKAVTA